MLAARKARLIAAGLALSGLLGCVHQQQPPAPPAPPPPPVAAPVAPGPAAPAPSAVTPAAPSGAASAAPAPAAPNPPAPAPTRAPAGATAHAPAPARPASAPASTATPAGKPAGLAPASTATTAGKPAGPAPASIGAPAPAASPGPPPLNLASLEERLRDTHAIGLFTKLSLKNQVDDLLAQFRTFYAGQGALTLAELRRSYELLLMKVVTLLQDADPGLAGAVSSSREAIWAILSDRNRFNNL